MYRGTPLEVQEKTAGARTMSAKRGARGQETRLGGTLREFLATPLVGFADKSSYEPNSQAFTDALVDAVAS